MAFSMHREYTTHIAEAALSGEMLLIVRATRHCFIFSIQREKQEENRDIVRRQRVISQQQMAKIGIANTSFAKTSEVKSSPCSSPCTSSAIAGIPM